MIRKACMSCGKPTIKKNGLCSADCENIWDETYDTRPSKKELNAKWREVVK